MAFERLISTVTPLSVRLPRRVTTACDRPGLQPLPPEPYAPPLLMHVDLSGNAPAYVPYALVFHHLPF